MQQNNHSNPNSETSIPEVIDTPTWGIRKLSNHRLLSPKEEIELAKKVHGKNRRAAREAVNTLITCNLKLAIKIANEYTGFGCDLEDLVSEAAIGLQKAAQRFDAKYKAKFSTYAAWWIKQSIKRCIANNSRIVRVPVHIGEKYRKLGRITAALQEELGRTPTVDEIIEVTGLNEKQIKTIQLWSLKITELDAQLADQADSLTYGDMLIDDNAVSPADEAQRHLDNERVQRLLKALPKREQHIIDLRFGLSSGDPETLGAIGDKIGVTRERIRQLQNIILRKLRKQIEKEQSITTETTWAINGKENNKKSLPKKEKAPKKKVETKKATKSNNHGSPQRKPSRKAPDKTKASAARKTHQRRSASTSRRRKV